MRVADVLQTKGTGVDTITVHPERSLRRAMGIMIDNQIGALPVVADDGGLVGIITERDLFRYCYHNQGLDEGATVADVMTTELIVGVVDDEIEYIAQVMTKNRIRHIPIVQDGTLSGIVSIGDVIKHRLKDMSVTNRYLMEYINGGATLGIF
ncbi:CBS domain-containing protein [Gemmatimonas aurantiaca]|nr:CBS domain-containing protein [Gemmatimonas aurantiaca]